MDNKKSIKTPFKSGGMFEGASHIIFANAKKLRNNMTDTETILWMRLKAGINGCKIRRQHPISFYIADFYCHKANLIIELDGSIHNKPEVKENDKNRENDLISMGYKIIRFTNNEVIKDITQVLEKISKVIESQTLQK
jgi:imidazole glycerol-phosphate synthase subunit HisF